MKNCRVFKTRLRLAAVVLPLALFSCAKEAAGLPDYYDSLPEANIILTGNVLEMGTDKPIPGISVTLLSYRQDDALQDNPVSRETVQTGQDGSYRLYKRFNAPAYSLQHKLQFEDRDNEENGGLFQPQVTPVIVSEGSPSLTGSGYVLEVNAFLTRAE